MIYDHFRATGVYGAGQLKAHQICLMLAYMTMTFRISIQDGMKLRYKQVKHLRNMFLKVRYKMKLQVSAQLQTVLAMFDQIEDDGMTTC